MYHLMRKLVIFTVLVVVGCATKSDYVLPDQARKLNAEEITQAFSNVRENYESIHDPGLTATVIYIADGYFSANWEKGWFSHGSLEGNWYTDSDQLCIKSTIKFDGSDLHCVSIYEFDGKYTAVHPDGSFQGTFTLKPLGEILSSERLLELFVGNSVHTSYPDDDGVREYWEYFDEDGTLFIRDSKYGDFLGVWEIRDGGCFYSNYDETDKYDGCYYYLHDSGNTYGYHRPWSDEMGHEKLVEGNPERLGEE